MTADISHADTINKVFISHATEKDGPLAHYLADGLKKEGIDAWIAPESIAPGVEWVDAINRGLKECNWFVLLQTSAATYSTWVNLEMSTAIMLEREGRLRIFPISVEACEAPPLWRTYQAVSFTDLETCLRNLVRAIIPQAMPDLESALRIKPSQAFRAPSSVYSAAFTPDGQMLLAALQSGEIGQWNYATGTRLESLQAHQRAANCIAFHPGGGLLASASADQTIRLWTMPEGKLCQTLEGHTDAVQAVSFSPDGRWLVSGSRDSTLRLWAIPDGTMVRMLQGHKKSVYGVAFSPDGKRIASVSSDNTVRLWSAEGEESAELGEMKSTILSVAFSPDGKLLATGSWGGPIRLWDVERGARGHLLKGHDDRVYRLAFSPDGTLLASGSKDTAVRLWEIPSGEPACPPLKIHGAWVHGLAFSPDGNLMVSADTDGLIQLWQVSN